MIIRLALLGGLALLLYAGLRWWSAKATAAQKNQALRWAAVGVMALTLLLASRGGVALVIPLLLLVGPLLRRWLPTPAASAAAGDAAAHRRSQITTRFLEMSLEHDSGVMRGTVMAGRYQGRRVEDLEWPELAHLWRECQSDPQSVAVLEAYLDRTQAATWREQLDGRQADAPAGLDMDRQEAYEILGLRPGATPADIKAAHRRLSQRVHPDRGGSDYLAARVNKAKDLLLKN